MTSSYYNPCYDMLTLVVIALFGGALAQQCVNLDVQCQSWGRHCDLPEIKSRCPVTCGLCPNTPMETETVVVPRPAVLPVVPVAGARPVVNVGCNDRFTACTNSAWTALCGHNRQVQADCPRSCGLCPKLPVHVAVHAVPRPAVRPAVVPVRPIVPVRKVECKDVIDDCAGYIQAGWCEWEVRTGHKGMVSKNCRKSCGFCR